MGCAPSLRRFSRLGIGLGAGCMLVMLGNRVICQAGAPHGPSEAHAALVG